MSDEVQQSQDQAKERARLLEERKNEQDQGGEEPIEKFNRVWEAPSFGRRTPPEVTEIKATDEERRTIG